jgi:hypothetical protein
MSDPFELYQLRRASLSTQLTEAKAEATRIALQQALLQTDVTAAAVYDLSLALRRVALAASVEAEQGVQAVEEATTDLAKALQALQTDTAAQQQLPALLPALAKLQAESAVRHLHLRYLQWTLLGAVGETWTGALEDLYGAADRAAFFARLRKIGQFAATRVPVVGEMLECVLVAFQACDWDQAQVRDADAYFRSLESYSDAANLWLAGVLSFCLEVEGLAQGGEPATVAQVQERVRAHIESVVNRTHAVCATEDQGSAAGAPSPA